MMVRSVVEGYWQAEETRNVETIITHYHPHGSLTVPNMGRLEGHGEIRRFYEDSVAQFPHLHVKILDGIESGNQGIFEWEAIFRDPWEKIFVLRGVNVVIVENARLWAVRVYDDHGSWTGF